MEQRSFKFSAQKLALLNKVRGQEKQEAAAPAGIARRDSDSPAPLSFAQQRLWFVDQLNPGTAAYNLPVAYRLRGPLNTVALELALGEIVRRHDALRTTFQMDGDGPVQIVAPTMEMPLALIDIVASAEESREAELRDLIDGLVRQPFDLAHGPLLRATLLRLGDEDHALVVVMHHIVADGWSFGVFNRELAKAYEVFRNGQQTTMEDLPLQYADFAAWQRNWLSGETLERQLRHWKGQFADYVAAGAAPLALPTDRPRPPRQTFNGAIHRFTLPADLASSLRALSQRAGATPFMTLLAAFQALLHRYSGQSEIVVGTSIANRNRAETEGLIGFFVNTLALRADLADDPSFTELLRRVRETTLDAYANQDLPFEKLVEELHPERSLSQSPLFQVAFLYQNTPTTQFQLTGLASEPIDTGCVAAKFDLTLVMEETGRGLTGELEYNTDLFDAATIARLHGHFETLLAGIIANAETPISRLPLLTEGERHQLLVEWNATEMPLGPDLCLPTLFETQVVRTPGAVAVEYEGEHLTYSDLNRRADELAASLRRHGVGPGVLVGICMERSIELVVALLGVLKAGGAYIPVDPGYPRERIALMLDDSRAPVLLTQAALVGQLPAGERRVVVLDDEGESKAIEEGASEARPASPDDPAYVIYTSGSTGRPKGVVISHRAIVNHMRWFQATFRLDTDDRVLQKTPFSFDASVWEFYAPLLVGARLVMARPGGHQDTGYLTRTIAERRITILQLVPTLLGALLDEPRFAECRTLRHVYCGGEVLTRDLQGRFFAAQGAALHNLYGPTEATIDATYWTCQRGSADAVVPIGHPVANMRTYVLDANLQLVPVGLNGELYLGGAGLAIGYLHRPELTADRFIADPFGAPGDRLYKTGDVVRRRPDGALEYLDRSDHQLKLRGFRIELGEIEAALRGAPGVREAVVVLRDEASGERRLVAYIVGTNWQQQDAHELRGYLKAHLPEYMVPAALVALDGLPQTPNGKVDRKALPAPTLESREETPVALPRTELERVIAEVWRRALRVERVGVHDNFFDLGGHSLLLIQVHQQLRAAVRDDLSVVDLFANPTIASLAAFLSGEAAVEPQVQAQAARRGNEGVATNQSRDVAIVGMGIRFPGARNVAEFWRNIAEGRESVAVFSDAELLTAGEDPTLMADPRYVRREATLDGIDQFDADFFGFTPREAEILDPQQRLFLECAWEALEGAGHDPARYAGRIGIYAGAGMSRYLLDNLLPRRDIVAAMGDFQLMLSNDKDFLPTRVSYKLNLNGPSVSVNTACSTSLVAVHMARQSLLNGECDMALAGGVTIAATQPRGYLYEQGGILSADGHCRAFDADASGTVGGSGAGIVVLKRLADALADGDTINAVIKGSAINNDGAQKVGFTAPSVEGQAAVIAQAQADAGIAPETIGYVEAHGTGTALGDPIEIAALTRAFRLGTDRAQFCAIGSVKTNIGHTDTAAGVAGLIKAVLALKYQQLPPSLHYAQPNPKIDFAASPFFVNTALRDWEAGEAPRRAGVSAFGIGGTNAHVVLEEAGPTETTGAARSWQIVPVSAKTATALDAANADLAAHLRANPGDNLTNVAHTLRVGRRAWEHRRVVVARDGQEVIAALEAADPRRTATRDENLGARPAAFIFPGQGSQHAQMGRELYRTEPVYREAVDRCVALLQPHLDFDLQAVLSPRETDGEAAEHWLRQTSITQPALFVVEYALAQLWMSWGVQPQAMLGHSVGEFVAATLAGVFSLEDALLLVAERGRLMQELPGGAMLAVPLSEAVTRTMLGEQLSLAAVNGPEHCVVSGPVAAVDYLEQWLTQHGLSCRRLHTSHAFHSAMMEPIVAAFAERVGQMTRNAPKLRYISCVTGDWITAEEAGDPEYWARHLRQEVRFADGMRTLAQEPGWAMVEVGPGRVLTTLARGQVDTAANTVTASLPHPRDRQEEPAAMLDALGQLWLAGVTVDWAAFDRDQGARRIPLPTYPFERRRYWIEPKLTAIPLKGAAVETAPVVVPASSPAPVEAPSLTLYARPVGAPTYVAPRDEIEEGIAAAWRELLGVEEISAYDDFFDLGGHSLLATQLLARLRDRFGVELPLETPFESPTLEGLAVAVLQAKAEQADGDMLERMLAELEV